MDDIKDEDIHERHKREQKELQAQIQALKHGVPKGDKKRKKQVTIEIAQLQAKLDEKQASELAQDESVEDMTTKVDDIKISEENFAEVKPQKVSKAQKRREKKEAEERERRKRLEEGEKDAVNHVRNVEADLFNKLLDEIGMRIEEVNPDGNCLYQSIVLQHTQISLQDLRTQTSEYMLEHVSDFLPFTCDNDTGEMLTLEGYKEYCAAVKDTNAWGGQLELRAISQLLKKPIDVFQSSSPVLHIGEEFNDTLIRLSYHRHQYGLGEHYNALLPKAE